MKKLILLFITLFLVTGCYNYHDLNELGIASSILIDYTDQFEVTVEILEDEKSETYKGSGKTLDNAFNNIILGTERDLYYNHLDAIILTENVNVKDIISYFMRNPEVNNTFYLVITETTDIYKEDKFGKTLSNILKRDNMSNFFDITQTLFEENQDMAIPYLNRQLKIESIAAYDEQSIAFNLSLEEIDIYKLLTNNTGSNIVTSYEGENVEIKVNEITTKYKLNDEIKIAIELEASLVEIDQTIDTSNLDTIAKIEESLNKEIVKQTATFIDKLKYTKSDILGIDKMLYNKFHNLLKTFEDYNYEIEVKTHINKKGLLLK